MRRAADFLASARAIYVLVALFVLLGALYSVTTPIFEAGDELWHYPYVQWLARGNGLPVQDPAQKQLWEQEGGQPPLYYAFAAAATFWIDASDLPARLRRNPYAKIGVPLAFGNKNLVVHTSAEHFPWQGTTLAVHLIRLLSVLFSAGTVYLTWRITREILAQSSVLSLVTASLVAFNPMFLFISASVNNDSLAALTATAALYLTIRLITRGATNRRILLVGVVVGLAILTKVSNLALGVVVMTVLAYCAWRAKRISWLVVASILFVVPIVLLAGWWFARNSFLYGDPTAFNVWLQIAGGRPPQTLPGLLDEFQGFRISFWGNFGGVNVIAPERVYATLDVFTLLAILGFAVGALRRSLPALVWIPALHLAVVFVALVRWTLMTYASQGRLVFPAIAAVAILLALGLFEFGYGVRLFVIRYSLFGRTLPFAQRSTLISPLMLPVLLSLFLLVFAIAAPFLIITPVYAQPARLYDEAQVPNPVHIKFDAGDGQPELVGFETTRFLRAGQELPVRLYWRTASPIGQDLAMYVHVYDVRGELIGQWDAFTGNGLYPTRLWQPNEIIVDEYRVPVQVPDAYPPIGRIEVGMAHVGDSNVLPARNPQGQTITPSLAQFKFSQPTGLPAAARVVLGEQFNLVNIGVGARRGTQEIALDENSAQTVSLKPGDVLIVRVMLQARQIPDADYTLFAHLVDASGNIVAQRDAQPQNNTYPTSLWNANEQTSDNLEMTVPRDAAAGKHTLEFGMYRASDLQRLPIKGAEWGIWRVEGDHLVAPVEIAP